MWLTRAVLIYILGITTQVHGWEEFSFFENISDFIDTRNENESACDVALTKYRVNFGKTNWSRRMIDATAKFPSGVYELNKFDYGSYDECLAISDPRDEIKAMYCLAIISITHSTFPKNDDSSFPLPKTAFVPGIFPPFWAICLPDGCSASELGKHFPKEMVFTEQFCQSESSKPDFTTEDKLALAFFAIVLALIIFSTLYDLYARKRSLKSIPILLAFSFLTNGKKLLTVSNDPNQIKCIGGIRAISMMWIILGHQYIYFSLMMPIANFSSVLSFLFSNDSMFIKAATVSVDTFFLLSGIVMVYVFMKTKTDGMCFNVPMYYLHRYLRLTPSLAVLILFHVTLLRHLGSGPMWSLGEETLVAPCKENWWSTLLYVQNWVNPTAICINVSWYLAVDTQLFIFSPLILIPLKKYTKSTLSFVVLLACVSIGCSYYVAWKYKFHPYIDQTNMNYLKYYYNVTHTRAAPWLIGVVAGYFIHEIKFQKIRIELNKFVVIILWMASLGILCACVFAGNEMMTTEFNNTALKSAHIAFVRPSWALALAWVVFACILGYGGIINDFLSLSIFQIIARVTYSLYLTHFTVLGIFAYSSRTPPRFSNVTLLYLFWAHFMVVLGISIIWTLAFESPILIIEKLLRGTSTDRGKIIERERTDSNTEDTKPISLVLK